MTGPKLFSMIIFGTLAFFFAFLFSIGLNNAFGSLATATIGAALTCAFIWFARSARHAFARGFLGLGAVFIIVPVAALAGFGEQISNGAMASLQSGTSMTEEETSALVLSSVFASAGLVFGLVVGLILILIGGLMHRNTTATPNSVTE
ncbi:hypothetical protein [Gymnodinialimonas ceratoperidinii]|uniref:Uncharacterized protein n=1 Tax=Gymnodinialimonas ceratoperidinii TaxID=2856823 RepID=A0A8F6YAR2_9RHOB|nr:hypothetical protein [Gymnodinialimonas ceratoperidinii]QXT39803.1 hypothetical protein KYE46_00640 [Gymnodinialimonas ceratoperidinii]